MHGPKGSRRKQSEYAVALGEKQKLRYQYGVLDKQFRRYYQEAVRVRGDSSQLLIELLERRLDAVVYRMKFAITPFAARQFISHGHVQVNGRKVNIPSYQVKVGDEIKVPESSQKLVVIEGSREFASHQPAPAWLSVDHAALSGKVIALPKREDVNLPVNEQLIVELYSK